MMVEGARVWLLSVILVTFLFLMEALVMEFEWTLLLNPVKLVAYLVVAAWAAIIIFSVMRLLCSRLGLRKDSRNE